MRVTVYDPCGGFGLSRERPVEVESLKDAQQQVKGRRYAKWGLHRRRFENGPNGNEYIASSSFVVILPVLRHSWAADTGGSVQAAILDFRLDQARR